MAVDKSLVEFKKFASEEEAMAFSDGRIWSSTREIKGKHWRMYSRVGELAVKAVREAGKYYKLNVDLDSEYIVGLNWADTH